MALNSPLGPGINGLPVLSLIMVSEDQKQITPCSQPRGCEIVVVLIYVDDIVITCDDKSGIERTDDLLKTSFDIKDLGELKYFLGIEVCRFEDRYQDLSERELLADVGQY